MPELDPTANTEPVQTAEPEDDAAKWVDVVRDMRGHDLIRRTSRLDVPGGWLYRETEYVDSRTAACTMVFVPGPPLPLSLPLPPARTAADVVIDTLVDESSKLGDKIDARDSVLRECVVRFGEAELKELAARDVPAAITKLRMQRDGAHSALKKIACGLHVGGCNAHSTGNPLPTCAACVAGEQLGGAL